MRIKEITDTRVRYGYRRVHVMLGREGHRDNVKRVYRLYRQEGLSLRLKRPRRNKAAKPTDNARVESFNGRLRQECLNAHWFLSMDDVRDEIAAWRTYYNESRPHSALDWGTSCPGEALLFSLCCRQIG